MKNSPSGRTLGKVKILWILLGTHLIYFYELVHKLSPHLALKSDFKWKIKSNISDVRLNFLVSDSI